MGTCSGDDPDWDVDLTTTAGYSAEEQAAYCANYCIEGEHHPACARRNEEARAGLPSFCRENVQDNLEDL